MNLSPRLLAVAELVRNGARIADIGTDHAYLPAYLMMSGRVVSAIASDIGIGPLENARDTVIRYNLQDKIDLRLSDGLAAINQEEVDYICICGMGGELIAQIIDNASWVKNSKIHLILQPMSAVDDLRIYLADNGFTVNTEKLVKDSGRIYCVMDVTYSGEIFEYLPEYPFIGNIICDSELAEEYISTHLKRITKHINMLSNATDKTDLPRLVKIRESIIKRLGDYNA